MVNILNRLGLTCAGIFFSISIQAKDLPSYKIGDKAAEDITASVAFDVVDDQATAALKVSKAQTIAAIYRQITVTNTMAVKFLAAFADAQMNFSNAVTATYHQPVIDNSTIEASDFGYFVTAFNVEHRQFPVPAELAVTWARGDSGAALRDKWLGLLMQAMVHPVQPDAIPTHFVYQKKIRAMLLTNVNESLTFTRAWRHGYIISADKVPTISIVRSMFRQKFSEDEQPLAGTLSQFIQPDCFPDIALTKGARDYTVRQMVVSDHFDAGQVVIQQGTTIGLKQLAALDAMHKALMPGALNQQIAAEQEREQTEHQQALQAQLQAQSEHDAAQLAQRQQQQAFLDRQVAEKQAQQEGAQAAAMHEQALSAQILARKIRARDEWLFIALTGVSVLALLILWRLVRQRGMPSLSVPAKLQRMEKPAAVVPAELAPLLAQTLKEAVVQGLAAQRAELLEAQRMAATEISELVNRLDQLQAPMQERLRAYQDRIQELQKELSDRTEENRELLKMKIEMMRKQLETERGRVNFN
jgi:hypothetical protein